MSTTYGTTSAITIPSDGDQIDAADVNVPICAMWDQHDTLADTASLTAILVPTHGLARHVRGQGHYVFVTSGTYSATTAQSPWILASGDGTAGRWVRDDAFGAVATIGRRVSLSRNVVGVTAITAKSGTTNGPWDEIPSTATPILGLFTQYFWWTDVNSATASARHVLINLDDTVMHGATLESATLYLRGAAGHGGLPAGMPALSIIRWDVSVGTIQELRAAGIANDASGTVAAYEAFHGITYTCDQNHVIDRGNYSYSAILVNEAHTNAAAYLKCYSLELLFSARGYR